MGQAHTNAAIICMLESQVFLFAFVAWQMQVEGKRQAASCVSLRHLALNLG